jgi:hypothetical protein
LIINALRNYGWWVDGGGDGGGDGGIEGNFNALLLFFYA